MIPGEIYHIYNHANGSDLMFTEERDYNFFLRKLGVYILPVCRIFAFCLMPNHFHILVRIKPVNELPALWQSTTLPKLENKLSKCFANFFSSYTQSFNKKHKRIGSLFIPSMKNILVNDDIYFLKLVHYIHANPVHHKFTVRMEDWKYSSYNVFQCDKPTNLERAFVLNEFDGRDGFQRFHQRPIDLKIKNFD